MTLDKELVGRVLDGVATIDDCKTLGRENVLAIKSDASVVHHQRLCKASPPSVNVDKRSVRYELSNDMQDRSGDVVNVAGIDLKNWQANPVWMFNHDRAGPDSLPIGRVERAVKRQVDGRRALFTDVVFHGADKNPKAELIWKLVADGDMPASSIGFRPLDGGIVRPQTDKERKELKLGPYGVYFKSIEILEGSSVVVPDNPTALVKKLDALADEGAFSWAVIGEITEQLKQAKGRAFVALSTKEQDVEVIDELPNDTKQVAQAAPPTFDESTLRKIIREEVSEALGAVRVKATDTPAASEPTREADPVGFMRSVLEQIANQNV